MVAPLETASGVPAAGRVPGCDFTGTESGIDRAGCTLGLVAVTAVSVAKANEGRVAPPLETASGV